MESSYIKQTYDGAEQSNLASEIADIIDGRRKNDQQDLYNRQRFYRSRNHNLLTNNFQYRSLAEPMMMTLLKHFYDMEIKKPGKLDEFDLGISLDRNFFNDFKIVNL